MNHSRYNLAMLRDTFAHLESRERHATLPIEVPQDDAEARRLCDLVLHDLSLPSATTTELSLARYLLDKLGADGPR